MAIIDWTNKIKSKNDMIDIEAARRGKRKFIEAADNLRALAAKLEEISADCGDDALSINTSWLTKKIYGFINGVKQIFTGKIQDSVPSNSIANDIHDVAEELNGYATVLETNGEKLFNLFDKQYGDQQDAYEDYLRELARKKAEEEMKQGGVN